MLDDFYELLNSIDLEVVDDDEVLLLLIDEIDDPLLIFDEFDENEALLLVV
jgi:hypothetical protein